MESIFGFPDILVNLMNPREFVVAGKRWRRCEWRISLYQSLDTEMKNSNLSALTLLGTSWLLWEGCPFGAMAGR
jgi:hypothetical protein